METASRGGSVSNSRGGLRDEIDSREITESTPRAKALGRDERTPVATLGWSDLLYLHWRLPIEEVRRRVPFRLELDLFEEEAWVTAVSYAVHDARPTAVALPAGLSYLEVDLRTYVRHRGRRGVYCFSVDASSLLAVELGKIGMLRCSHANASLNRNGRQYVFWLTRKSSGRKGQFVRYRPGETTGLSTPGTLQHFLLERRVCFAPRGPFMFEWELQHDPLLVQRCEIDAIADELVAAARLPLPSPRPEMVHYVKWADVSMYPPTPRL